MNWTQTTNSMPLTGCAIKSYNNKLYAFGAWDGSKSVNYIYSSLDGITWNRINSGYMQPGFGRLGIFNNEIYHACVEGNYLYKGTIDSTHQLPASKFMASSNTNNKLPILKAFTQNKWDPTSYTINTDQALFSLIEEIAEVLDRYAHKRGIGSEITSITDWNNLVGNLTSQSYSLMNDLIFNNSFGGNIYLKAGKEFNGKNNTIFLNNLSNFNGLFNLHSGDINTTIKNLRVVASNVELTTNNGFFSQGSSDGSVTANGNVFSSKLVFKNSTMNDGCGGFIGASSQNIIIGNLIPAGTGYLTSLNL